MRIGIVGAGSMGAGLAGLWSRAGHEVTISSRHPASIIATAARLGRGVRVATVREAAASADIVVLATGYATIGQAVDAIGPLDGRLVIDVTHPYRVGREGQQVRLLPAHLSAASQNQRRLPRAHVVKAYTAVSPRDLVPGAQHQDGLPLAVLLCGDDRGSKRTAAELISDSGFAPIDVGGLARSLDLETGGGLLEMGLLPAPQMRELLALRLWPRAA